MADKSEFVDMISEATRQTRRRVMQRAVEPEAKERSKLSHWPPDRWQQWRLGTRTPWKLKALKFNNWDLRARLPFGQNTAPNWRPIEFRHPPHPHSPTH